MQFRSRMFYGFALACLILTGVMIASATATTSEESSLCNNAGVEGMADCQTGIDAIQVFIVLCFGFPITLGFALLGWRNAAGKRSQDRHEEALQAASSDFGGF